MLPVVTRTVGVALAESPNHKAINTNQKQASIEDEKEFGIMIIPIKLSPVPLKFHLSFEPTTIYEDLTIT